MLSKMNHLWKIVVLLTILFIFVGFFFVNSESSRTQLTINAGNQESTAKAVTVTPISEVEILTKNYSGLKNENTIAETECRMVKQLIFAKTHKTGSTTLQNIIFRFGEKNKLTFVLPKSGKHFFYPDKLFGKSMAEPYKKYMSIN